jgi:hypothetical protein
MQLHELLGSDVLLEMAYTQKKAERIITSLERPINDNLLKLWTNPDSVDQERWRNELVNWIDEIAEIVIRPGNTRPPHIFFYKLLFFEPFGGGAEIPNILRRLRRLHREGLHVPPSVTPDILLTRLRTFHRDLSSLCAAKLLRTDQIRIFLDQH